MSIMVGPKFFRVQTDLETNLGHISSSGLNRGTEGWSPRRVIKPNWMQESLDLLICMGGPRHWITCQRASHCSTMQPMPLLTGPHLPALISISMSASCSQYVITILPGFLALSANLKPVQRLRFVRIQLVKRSGTKEAAASLWTFMPGLRNWYWINASLIGAKCRELLVKSKKLSVMNPSQFTPVSVEELHWIINWQISWLARVVQSNKSNHILQIKSSWERRKGRRDKYLLASTCWKSRFMMNIKPR